ncbi:MAG TPA: carboxypeptidase-like regulatory domain-containing protein [Candidatus Limnocylindrales bacterium]|nr:carboxypeptidase-like regulatory domain-containing protein [Candidatus Limnocylindrales bacterium]
MEPIDARVRHRRMRTPSPALPALLILLLVALVACGGSPGPGASGDAPGSPPASAQAPVTTAEGAAAAVKASSPLFDGIEAQDPDVIGGSAWWTATPVGPADDPTAWTVVFEVGWGDCPAGCIDRHTWTYEVAADGAVTLVEEAGSPLLDEILSGLYASAEGTGVGGRVLAGPTCPVEDPADPTCAGRTVPGATLTVTTPSGEAVTSLVTNASGLYRFGGLAPGEYVLVASAVEGLMGAPSPAPFTVREGEVTPLDVSYDTGIR